MNILQAKALVDQVVDRNFSSKKADISDLVRGLTIEQQQAMKRLNDSAHDYRNTRRRDVFIELRYHHFEYEKILFWSRLKIGVAFSVLGIGAMYIMTRHVHLSVFVGLAIGFLASSVEKETSIFASFLDDYPKPFHVKGSWYKVQKQRINTIRILLSS